LKQSSGEVVRFPRMYICSCTCLCMYVCMFLHIHVYTYIHICMHINIHTLAVYTSSSHMYLHTCAEAFFSSTIADIHTHCAFLEHAKLTHTYPSMSVKLSLFFYKSRHALTWQHRSARRATNACGWRHQGATFAGRPFWVRACCTGVLF
jgi:hypothetical protein